MSVRAFCLTWLFACFITLLALPARADNASPADWGDKLEQQHGSDWEVNTTPDGAMYQVLTDLANTKPEDSWAHGPCELAALNAAWDVWGNGQGIGIVNVWGKTIHDIGSNLWGLGKAVGEDEVEDFIIDTIKDGYKDSLKDKLKEFLKGKKVKADVFKWAGKRGNCDVALYVVVDVASSTVEVLINGDCHCNLERCYNREQSTMLGPFSMALKGTISYKVGKDKIEGVSIASLHRASFIADCKDCEKKKDHSTTGNKPEPGSSVVPVTPGTVKVPVKGETSCPACQSIANDLAAAQEERDNKAGDERNLENNLTDIEDGRRAAGDKPTLDAQLKAIRKRLKELDATIKELQKKKADCEAACGEHASTGGFFGFSATKGRDRDLDRDRANATGNGTTRSNIPGKRGIDDTNDAKVNGGSQSVADTPAPSYAASTPAQGSPCVYDPPEKTALLSPAQRVAAESAARDCLGAQVTSSLKAESAIIQKYDDQRADLNRRHYGTHVMSEETYTSQRASIKDNQARELGAQKQTTEGARQNLANYNSAASSQPKTPVSSPAAHTTTPVHETTPAHQSSTPLHEASPTAHSSPTHSTPTSHGAESGASEEEGAGETTGE